MDELDVRHSDLISELAHRTAGAAEKRRILAQPGRISPIEQFTDPLSPSGQQCPIMCAAGHLPNNPFAFTEYSAHTTDISASRAEISVNGMIKTPRPPKLDEWAIRAELGRRGLSFSRMGAESGISPKAFSAAFKKPSERVNKFIAQKLGIPVHELWPFWFDADGDLIPAKWRKKLSTRARRDASHESAAA